MVKNLETRDAIKALAGSLKPTTLAAVLADLAEHDQADGEFQHLQDYAARKFLRQLECMVGVDEAARMVSGKPFCPDCGSGDVTGGEIEGTDYCKACGLEFSRVYPLT